MADQPQTISFLEALRNNRAGALLSGLIVTVLAALILSAAVPDDLNAVTAILLIVLLAAAVGFTIKATSPKQDGSTMFAAGGLAALGVPILFDAGMGGLSGSSGLSYFDDSILISLFDTYLTVGSALAAVVAITITAWGARSK